MRRFIAFLALALAALSLVAPAALAQAVPPTMNSAALRAIPIQNQGRLKPLDTFARETMFTITGKERFEGRPPLDVLIGWMHDPKAASQQAVIDVSRQDVRAALGLPDNRWISYEALVGLPAFTKMRTDIMQKERAGEKLAGIDQHMVRLLNRVSLFGAVITGEAWTIVPDPKLVTGEWKPLTALGGEASSLSPDASKAILQAFGAVTDAYAHADEAGYERSSRLLAEKLAAVGPQPDPANIAREVHYNDLHPFGKAWMLYLAALLVLGAATYLDNRKLYLVGAAIAVGGFVMHVYGFILRCQIAGRPPVTNMYESIIWVSLGAMACALVLEAVFQARSLLVPAAAAATLCLILADNTSSLFDPAINPLTPVLRSNFWLTIHVLTITASYGAFLLATALGHVILWKCAFGKADRASLRSLQHQLYKTVQVGVLLLAAGTILGGVWANYSWGRFWGWDPKEVWALIALLGYLAVLHGRYAGWLKDFGFAAGCAVAFCGVIMAWYGVNFVLGAGLHSYGFGEGGQQYVGTAVALDMLYVALAGWRYRAIRAAVRPGADAGGDGG